MASSRSTSLGGKTDKAEFEEPIEHPDGESLVGSWINRNLHDYFTTKLI